MDARRYSLFAAAVLSLAGIPVSADEGESAELYELGRRTQRTQEQVLDFERDLQVLEAELAAPAGNPRMEIYLSLSAGRYFRLDRVELEVDGKPLVRHDYDLRAREALRADGAQLLYRGPVPKKAQRLRLRYAGKGGERPAGEAALDLTRYPSGLLMEVSIDDAPAAEERRVRDGEDEPRLTDLNARVWALGTP